MKLEIVYQPTGKAAEYAKWATNLYEGRCGHKCIYCYAPRALHKKPEEMCDPKPKKDALLKLEHDARELRKAGVTEHILLSFTTDPYQPIEDKLCITRTAIEILLSQGLGISILTKGGRRSERDFDLLTGNNVLAGCSKPRYGTTLVFVDDFDARKHEPFAAPTSERINSLKKAHEMGIYTWVSLEPVFYPSDAYQLIQETHEFVDEFKVGKLNYMEHAKNVNWKEFAVKVEEKLKACGAKYYLKSSLREAGWDKMFTIRPLSDRQIADASVQYRIESVTGYVDFAILDGELCAHTWQCPKEGREFLQALEKFAEKHQLKLVIPNTFNPALEYILITSGYLPTQAWDNYLKRMCEVWAKTNLFPKPKKEKMQNMYLLNRTWQQKEE